ncbi:hypothetical protein ACSSZE_03260 [Acidithiobacillus caldus]
MSITYLVQPKKLGRDGTTVEPAFRADAEFYGVYLQGIREHWGIGGKGEDSDKLLNHLRDFPTEESAQAFVQYLQRNTTQRELLEHAKPIQVLGVRYLPSTDRGPDGKSSRYVPELALSDRSSEYRAVTTWEIDRYLLTNEASPDLAANALIAPSRFPSLNPYERESLKEFAQSARIDPFFRSFREVETQYMRDAGVRIPEGVQFRISILDDMPENLQRFVREEAVVPGTEALQHPAIKHLEAIANHQAIAQFRQMQSLPHMPERAKALYGDTLLRNYPDLSRLYEQAKQELQKLDRSDPILMKQIGQIGQIAQNLPDLEAGLSSSLVSTLQSYQLPTNAARKP